MRRGCWSALAVDASDGRYRDTSGPSFSMKESGSAAVAGAGAVEDMMLTELYFQNGISDWG